jgi:hypothetical protein
MRRAGARAGATCAFRDRKGPADRAHPTVERELADGRMLADAIERHLPGGGEDRQSDGQVERRALLAERRRRKVHGDAPLAGPLEGGGVHARAHAVLRLLARTIGEPDDREPG